MSIVSKAQALQLDVDNAIAAMVEVETFLYREWAGSEMNTARELHIHSLRVDFNKALTRLRQHATGTE